MGRPKIVLFGDSSVFNCIPSGFGSILLNEYHGKADIFVRYVIFILKNCSGFPMGMTSTEIVDEAQRIRNEMGYNQRVVCNFIIFFHF